MNLALRPLHWSSYQVQPQIAPDVCKSGPVTPITYELSEGSEGLMQRECAVWKAGRAAPAPSCRPYRAGNDGIAPAICTGCKLTEPPNTPDADRLQSGALLLLHAGRSQPGNVVPLHQDKHQNNRDGHQRCAGHTRANWSFAAGSQTALNARQPNGQSHGFPRP